MDSTNTEVREVPGDNISSDARREGSANEASPVVLAQPAANEYAFPKSADVGRSTPPEDQATTMTLQLVKGRFAGARDAVVSRCNDASQSTDEFVHHNPWKSIAFATLGGIIVGMLAAR